MAATSAPFGFRPSFHNSGQIRPKAYTVASTYAANIFSGDPVKLNATGTVELATSDGTRTGTVDGIRMLGIAAGCEFTDALGKPNVSPFWPGGTVATGIVIYVYDDVETLFDVEYANPGTVGTDSVQTAVGKQADWTQAAPGGSTKTGLSATLLTALQATAGQFQIVGFSGRVGDTLTDGFVVAQVRINEAHYKATVNTIS